MKNLLKRFAGIMLAAFLILAVIPAAASPWVPYSQYIPDNMPVVKRHLRGAWITTVINMDWPTVATRNITNDAERIRKSKEELSAILDKAVEMNLNAVFFQVSPEGDAFYKSKIVPWSRYLTGTFGKDPGFDPLTFAIEECRKRNLEIHAWFNPYRVSMNTNANTVASLNINKSVYKEQPQWIRTAMDRFVVDPGIPEARQWVNDRIMEVVSNYDIDGVHFDDYFYYEKFEGEMKDQETFAQYNSGRFSNLGDWRRNNTYTLIKELSQKIRHAKPWVKFGISPSGVWGNKKDGHKEGSNTNAGFTNYNKCYADTKKWVEEEIIDYIAPQIYFSFGNPNAPYGEVATWWSGIMKGKKVHLYIGQALYKINDDPDQYFKGENAVPEFGRQLKFNIARPEIMGTIMFRFKNFTDTGKEQVANSIKQDIWATKALVPVMHWKGGKAPANPSQGKLDILSVGNKISWAHSGTDTAYYAIYRYNTGENIDLKSDASAVKLLGTVRRNNSSRQEFTDNMVSNPDKAVYVVAALDRLHNESSGLVIRKSLSPNFSDVGNEYSWAVEAIDRLFEKGIVKGDNLGRFNPGTNTKRADFILMMVRALDLKGNFTDNFTDVKKTSYYYDAVGIARALDIAKGSGTTFNPEGNITREDMMVILLRALEASGKKLEKAGEEVLSAYSDAKNISSYAREAVASLTKAGLIQGSGGRINPKALATRAEIAVILHRILP